MKMHVSKNYVKFFILPFFNGYAVDEIFRFLFWRHHLIATLIRSVKKKLMGSFLGPNRVKRLIVRPTASISDKMANFFQ